MSPSQTAIDNAKGRTGVQCLSAIDELRAYEEMIQAMALANLTLGAYERVRVALTGLTASLRRYIAPKRVVAKRGASQVG